MNVFNVFLEWLISYKNVFKHDLQWPEYDSKSPHFSLLVYVCLQNCCFYVNNNIGLKIIQVIL